MRLSTLWLSSGYAIRGPCLREMHIFAFSCQTRYRIASALYPCIALVGASIRHQVRGTTWLCLAFSSHRASNIETRLDLPCTRPDPHAPARVQPSTPPGLVFVGRARSGNRSQYFHPRLGEEGEGGQKEDNKDNNNNTIETPSTNTSTNRLQTTTVSVPPVHESTTTVVVCFFEPPWRHYCGG